MTVQALSVPYGVENMEAERNVIGSVIFDSSNFPKLSHLRPEHFALGVHQRAWEAVRTAVDAGRTPTLEGLKAALRGDPELPALDAEWRGGDYVMQIMSGCSPRTAPDMAALILDDYTRRRAVEIVSNTYTLATEANPRPAVELVSYMRQSVETLEQSCASADGDFLEAPTVAASVLANIAEAMRTGKTVGKKTGLRCIDYRLGGLQPGALIVIGGRPSMGKTALARAIAHGAAVHNPKDRVAFLGLEMSPDEMIMREVSAITHDLGDGVEFRDMARAALAPYQMDLAQNAQEHVPGNLILRDCSGVSVDDVRRYIWSLKRKCRNGEGLACVVIDYLQLMRRPDARGRNDAALIAEMTMALKQIARQAKTCIVLLSQLSRTVETREDKRPMLSDLRESGSIEQDADAVLFPFREAYYLERAKPPRGKEAEHDMEVMRLHRVMEVIAAKVRGGAVGTDRQTYYAEYDHISDEVR